MERRMAKLEQGEMPKPSPFTVWFGSFDAWVEREVLPNLASGSLDHDFIVVVAALRSWEGGIWNQT
jgi:hypothetical protein